jgi:long-chain fatty acid transport protein
MQILRWGSLEGNAFNMSIRIPVLALAALAVSVQVAYAGSGYSRGTANTDILWEAGSVNFDATATYSDPNRKFNKNAVSALNGTEYSKAYWVPNIAAKYSFNENLACEVTYTTPFGADSHFDVMNNRGKTDEKFVTREYGAACAVFVPVGPGRLGFIGGAYYEEFSYDFTGFTRVGRFTTPLDFGVDSHDWGWRAGIGYEIPEYAFRTQLLYRSGTSHEGSSTGSLPAFGRSVPVSASGELPQSVELKAQTGVAPGWLVFGSVKWTDWSVLDTLDLNLGGQKFSNYYYWRDGISVTGGVGHQFTDRISGAVTLAYDRGVSTGWDLYGDQYTVGLTGAVKDDWGGEWKASVAAAYLASAQETKYAPGQNSSSKGTWGYGLQIGYKIKF